MDFITEPEARRIWHENMRYFGWEKFRVIAGVMFDEDAETRYDPDPPVWRRIVESDGTAHRAVFFQHLERLIDQAWRYSEAGKLGGAAPRILVSPGNPGKTQDIPNPIESATRYLRDLHQLYEQAKDLRDRLSSGPKTLAARKISLEARQKALDEARKTLQAAMVAVKEHEDHLQVQQTRSDNLRLKLALVNTTEIYKKIQNQLGLDKTHMKKTQAAIVEATIKVDETTATVHGIELEIKKLAEEASALSMQIEEHADAQKAQLADLDKAIMEAEFAIDKDQREQYRRMVRQRNADAFASISIHACNGCNVTVSSQIMNELLNGEKLTFCQSCGRVLYLAEEFHTITTRSGRSS